MMIGLVIYFWVWTSDNRETDMDVIEQLCKKGSLDLTFHENRLFGSVKNGIDATAKEGIDKIKKKEIRESDGVVFHNFESGSMGYMPTLKWKADCDKFNVTSGLEEPKCLVLDDNIWDAFVEQMYNSIGDKTFILVMIFTISWSNWHLDLDEREVEKEEKDTPKEVKIEPHTEETKDEDKDKEETMDVFQEN